MRHLTRGVTPRGIFYGDWWVSQSMKSITRSIFIDAPSWKVFNFLADPESLTQWAVLSLAPIRGGQERGWRVRTQVGTAVLTLRVHPMFGVVDFHFVEDSQRWCLATRVVTDSHQTSEYIVTVFAPVNFGSRLLDRNVALIDRKLERLKGLMEGRG